MEEKIQWYELTPREKYGINEILNFVNTEKKILMRIDMIVIRFHMVSLDFT